MAFSVLLLVSLSTQKNDLKRPQKTDPPDCKVCPEGKALAAFEWTTVLGGRLRGGVRELRGPVLDQASSGKPNGGPTTLGRKKYIFGRTNYRTGELSGWLPT